MHDIIRLNNHVGWGLRICHVLELYLMNVCLSRFSLINLGENLSLNIIRIERLITTKYCYEIALQL